MSVPPQVLGIVLARAGSQGVPGKHLRDLLGRPVIDHALDTAVACQKVSRLVVSSDCPQVIAAARRRFITTIRRPADLATSNASVQGSLLHATQSVEAHGYRPDIVVCFYGNVPVRPVGGVDRAIDLMTTTGCDSVRSFIPVGKFHPGWMSKIDDAGQVEALRPGSIDRRQDLEPLFIHDGSVLVISRQSLERGVTSPADPHAMFGDNRRGIQIGESESIEIDRELDLSIAEALLKRRGIRAMTTRASTQPLLAA